MPSFGKSMIGVERHKDRWLHANRRAVETLWGTSLRADSAEVKESLPRVILAVLDGHMVDQGNQWNRDKKQWERRS